MLMSATIHQNDIEDFLKTLLGDLGPLVFSHLSKDQRRQIPSLDRKAEPFIVDFMATMLNYRGVSPHLKEAMSDSGFPKEKDQLGILLLCYLNSLSVPAHFDHKSAANKWLLEQTQKGFKRKGAERWSQENQIVEQKLEANLAWVFEAASFLGMTDSIYPKVGNIPTQVFVPGGLKMRVDLRLGCLVEYCAHYPLPSDIFLVTGERQLQPTEELEIKEPQQRTEKQMMERTMKRMSKGHPLAAVPCHVVHGKKRFSTRVKSGDDSNFSSSHAAALRVKRRKQENTFYRTTVCKAL